MAQAVDSKSISDLIMGIGAIISIGIIDGWWDYRKYKKKHPETTFKEWCNLPEEDDRYWED